MPDKNYTTKEIVFLMEPVLGHSLENNNYTNNNQRRQVFISPQDFNFSTADLSFTKNIETTVYACSWLADTHIDAVGNALVKAGSPVCRIFLCDYFDDGSVYGYWKISGMFKYHDESLEVAA